MAFVHGKSSVFKLDNASGSLTDISAYVNNVDFPETADVAETSVLGASIKKTISLGTGTWDILEFKGKAISVCKMLSGGGSSM